MTDTPTPAVSPAERESLFGLVTGYRVSQALYVVVRLGIPDHLASEAKTAAELAQETSSHPDRLYRVLRVLASHGVFSEDASGRFALTKVGSLLRSEVPGSLAALTLMQCKEGYRAFADLLHTVKTGETAFDHAFGMGHFEYNARNPDAGATFNRAMASRPPTSGDPLEGYDLRPHRVVVDVGGGTGAFMTAILQRHPHLRGILYDLPSLADEARERLVSSGVADRCEIRSGSALDSVPEGGDVYVLSRVLHDWPDEEASAILRNCRKALPKEGALLLKESIFPEGQVPPHLAGLDLMMMAMNGGRERTRREWQRLLESTGFSLVRAPVLDSNPDLIEARPV